MNYVIAAAILNDVRKNGKKSAFEEWLAKQNFHNSAEEAYTGYLLLHGLHPARFLDGRT